MIFAGKKVLVFGTGKSGIAAEELLHKKGASVVLYDGNDKLEKEEILKKLESRDSVRSEEHTSELQSLKRISYAVSLIGRAHVNSSH